MKFVISSRRVIFFLILGLVFLYFTTLVSRFFGMVGIRDGTILGELIEPFDIAHNDASVAAWYSSFLLLLCSLLLASIAVAKRRLGEDRVLHWGVLSCIFFLMSVDEIARLHEAFGSALEHGLSKFAGFVPSGALSFFWVVPGAVFVLVVFLAYIRFLIALPRRMLVLFVVAGMLFVGGAIVLEMVQARLTFESSELGRNEVYTLSWWIVHLNLEELFEMVGVIVFCYALLSYIGSYTRELSVGIVGNDKEEDV